MPMWKRFAVAVALATLASMSTGSSAGAEILRNMDFQTPGLLDASGHSLQWDNYDPSAKTGLMGITLGLPGLMPGKYTQAARFQNQGTTGRPRAQAVLNRDTRTVPGVSYIGAVDATQG